MDKNEKDLRDLMGNDDYNKQRSDMVKIQKEDLKKGVFNTAEGDID